MLSCRDSEELHPLFILTRGLLFSQLSTAIPLNQNAETFSSARPLSTMWVKRAIFALAVRVKQIKRHMMVLSE